MSVDQGEYLKTPPISEAQKEALSRGDILWEDGQTKIFYPENPLVPAQEGIHLRVESPNVPPHPKTAEEWKGWLRHWAKMIGASKVVAEGADLPDMWQSLIGSSEYVPGDHLVTDIIGRNPKGKSWGETAPFPEPGYNNRGNRIDSTKVQHLGKVLGRYFRKDWEPAMAGVVLFPEAPTVYPPGHEKFQEVYDRNTKLEWPWQSEPLFVSDKAEVIAILVPHLKTGIHLMIGIPDSPKRPWLNAPKALEGLAVAEGSAQILESNNYEGLPLAARSSIRATGSWFGGFKKIMDDPRFREALEKDNIPWKWFKRRQKGIDTKVGPGDEWKMGIGFHPHLYVARYPDELIRLTRRPATEGGPDWEGVVVMNEEKRHFMRDVLNQQLPQVLGLTRGKIVNVPG